MGNRAAEEKAHRIESIEPTEHSSEVAEITRTEEVPRASEEFWALFEAIDQGMTISKIILSDAGEGVDCRILEANARFEQVTGLSREKILTGKTVLELVPTLENSWVRKLGSVAVTGEPSRYEGYVPVLDRWLNVHSFRIGDPALRQVASLFKDVTSRHRADQALRDSERIKSYLLKLSDVLRPIADPMEVMRKGPEVLARELDVSAAGYVELSADGNSAVLGGQYADGRMPELAGACRLSDFGEGFGPSLAAGEDIFSSDVYEDQRGPAGGTDKTRGFNIRAVAGIPLIKNGRLVSLFYAVHFEARPWMESEREIVRQTAERTWATVERVRADMARRESEERYRTLFNSIDQGYAVGEVLYDGSGAPADVRFIEANHVFKEQAGLTNLGQSARKMIPNFDDDWARIYAHVANTGESVRFEKRSRGLGRWFNVFVSRVGGEGSRLVNIIKEDVTARKESDAALRESEERKAFLLRLSDALRPIGDPIEIQGTANRMLGGQLRTDCTLYAEVDEELGYFLIERDYVREGTPSKVGKYPLADFAWLLPTARMGCPNVVDDIQTTPLIPDADRAAVAGTHTGSFIAVPLIKDDRLVAALCVSNTNPRAWTDNEVKLVQETADRTWAAVERARVETALRESEERFRCLLENVHEYAFVQVDTELRMRSWNAGAERIFGYSSREALGQPFSTLLLPEDRPTSVPFKEFSRIDERDRSEDARWLIRKDGTQIWTRWVSEPIRDKDGQITGLTMVLRDETERLKTETSLRQSEKLAVVGRLASSIAHEINNPLEAITNLIFLARRGEASSEVAALLAQAERELTRVNHITTATLHFHRQTWEPVQTDLETILESVLLLHEGRLRASQIAIERRYGMHPSIKCQENEIRQVFANLVTNAIDAMTKSPDPRRLTVRVRKAVDSKTGEEGVRVMIADTGLGIQESAVKHIFEPFFTTKSSTGTGLGLWISAETVKRHRGTLRFRSRTAGPFRGTVFSMYLGPREKAKSIE